MCPYVFTFLRCTPMSRLDHMYLLFNFFFFEEFTNRFPDYLFDFTVFLFVYNVSAFFLKISFIIIITIVCARTHAHTTVRMVCTWKFVGSLLSVDLYVGSRDGTQDTRLVRQTVHLPNCLAGHKCLDFFTYPQTLVIQVPILVDVKWHCGFDFQGPNNSKLCIFLMLCFG